mmetsp:Transcript_46/g.117  ORF Transcript_46/g.117 Transcript_46/m.117 type:complete len:232 (-) Transcript_46:276-971(-)
MPWGQRLAPCARDTPHALPLRPAGVARPQPVAGLPLCGGGPRELARDHADGCFRAIRSGPVRPCEHGRRGEAKGGELALPVAWLRPAAAELLRLRASGKAVRRAHDAEGAHAGHRRAAVVASVAPSSARHVARAHRRHLGAPLHGRLRSPAELDHPACARGPHGGGPGLRRGQQAGRELVEQPPRQRPRALPFEHGDAQAALGLLPVGHGQLADRICSHAPNSGAPCGRGA